MLDGVIKSNEAELKELKAFSSTSTKIGCLIDGIAAKIRSFAATYFTKA